MMNHVDFFSSEELCEYCNEKLPLSGVVNKVDGNKGSPDFYYIKLPQEWEDFSAALVDVAEKLYKV